MAGKGFSLFKGIPLEPKLCGCCNLQQKCCNLCCNLNLRNRPILPILLQRCNLPGRSPPPPLRRLEKKIPTLNHSVCLLRPQPKNVATYVTTFHAKNLGKTVFVTTLRPPGGSSTAIEISICAVLPLSPSEGERVGVRRPPISLSNIF
jgi:hypothetical protein